jgi:L-alanine-DL-glutamate epimerase-like enolase superfamily enzyme
MNGRRSFLRNTAAFAGAAFWADETLEALPQNTNTNSKPSDLRITDMRVLTIGRAPMNCPLIRIDTNQGIYGLGEVRDGASKNYALLLKSRLLKENPATSTSSSARSSNSARAAGRRCALLRWRCGTWRKGIQRTIYQMLGGKFATRSVATPNRNRDLKVYGQRLKAQQQGFTCQDGSGRRPGRRIPGTVTAQGFPGGDRVQHMFTGIELTPKGVAKMGVCGAVREQVGDEAAIAITSDRRQ